jgi:hypothetical protein
MATPLLVGDFLYVLNNSVLSCHDAATGDLHYKQRVPGMATVAASPLAIDRHVIVVDEKGKVFFIQPGPSFSIHSSLELNETVWATPAIGDGRLLVRGVERLYCIEP